METANATRPESVSHTEEPWWAHQTHVHAYGHFTVADCATGDKPVAKADADANRIVACVNALAGIANPGAIPALIEAAKGMMNDSMNEPKLSPRLRLDGEWIRTCLAALDKAPE